MNLYFRLLLILIKGLFSQRRDAHDDSAVHFRSWPWDCDINFHMTASRYHALTDLARVYQMFQLRLLGPLLRRRWLPVIKTQVMTFHKSVLPFQKFQVRSRLLGWSGTSLYIEQKILVGDTVYASTLIKGAFVGPHGSIHTEDVAKLMGENIVSPLLQADIELLNRLIEARAPDQNSSP